MSGPFGPSVRAVIERSWVQMLVVGHRGSAATHPENTLPAFEEAVLCGAPAVECDVHASSDGELVVLHDHTLDRTTSLTGPVSEKTLAELRTAGVPSFGELLDLVDGQIVLVAEVKAGPEVARKVAETVARRGMTEQAILFSFDAESVREAKRACGDLYCVWLCGDDPGEDAEQLLAQVADATSDAVGLCFWHAHEPLAITLRQRGVPLFVWTVPPGLGVEHLRRIGANFVITDHPREVLAQLAEGELA